MSKELAAEDCDPALVVMGPRAHFDEMSSEVAHHGLRPTRIVCYSKGMLRIVRQCLLELRPNETMKMLLVLGLNCSLVLEDPSQLIELLYYNIPGLEPSGDI